MILNFLLFDLCIECLVLKTMLPGSVLVGSGPNWRVLLKKCPIQHQMCLHVSKWCCVRVVLD